MEMLAARPAGHDKLAGEGRPVRPLHEGGGPVALLQHQVGQPAGGQQLRQRAQHAATHKNIDSFQQCEKCQDLITVPTSFG